MAKTITKYLEMWEYLSNYLFFFIYMSIYLLYLLLNFPLSFFTFTASHPSHILPRFTQPLSHNYIHFLLFPSCLNTLYSQTINHRFTTVPLEHAQYYFAVLTYHLDYSVPSSASFIKPPLAVEVLRVRKV